VRDDFRERIRPDFTVRDFFCAALQGPLVAALELLQAAYSCGRMYRHAVPT